MAAGDPGTPKRNYSAIAVETTLTATISSQASGDANTSFIVASVAGFPSTFPYTLLVDPDTNKEEVLTVYAGTGTSLQVFRGQDGTQAPAHSAGATVRHGISAREFKELQTHIAARGFASDSSILSNVDTHVHGIASGEGDVVGTLKTQSLTNKTLTAPIITNPNITGAGVDASIVFEGATDDAFETTLTVVDPTQDNTLTLPNTTGIVVVNSAVQTLTNKTIDMTGVTLTGLSSAGMVTSSATPKDYVDAFFGPLTSALTSATSAATSATSAATSASSALTSATSAATSATAAATSAASAATSATAAATSASSASTSASSALTSQTAAATSATSAATSASSALTSANSASTSAANALTSANSAATSASTMAASVTAAASSATAAATSATSAAASATAAATSASSASTSATAAATSAASASTSASSALTSANSATTSASSALTSQTAAATSATSAAASVTAAATSATSAAASATAAATSATSASASATAAATSATSAAASATASASSATAASSSAVVAASYASAAPEFRQYGAEGSVLQNIPTRVHEAETLLKQAVWWIDSAHSGSSGQAIKNLGWGGAALDATAGSSTSADSNDPKYLAFDGTNYVYTPGVAVNVLDLASSAALQITGDLDLRVDVALDNYNSTDSQNILLGKVTTSGTVKEYVFQYEYSTLSGQLALVWRESGGTTRTARATASTSTITNGTRRTLRATLDVDNGAGQYEVKFFSSTDNITWTQIGATVTGATGVTNVGTGNGNVSIAATPSTTGGTFPTSGKFYRAQILNGIDGVPVLDVDTSVISTGAATSFTALTGQTVTINRSTSGRKTTCVTHPVWLFGTDDYMEVNNRWLEHTGSNYLYLPGVAGNNATTPDAAALDITGDLDVRVKVALDDWTPGTTNTLISKWQASTNTLNEWRFQVLTTGQLSMAWSPLGLGWNVANSTAGTVVTTVDGSIQWVRFTLDVDNGAAGTDIKFFTSPDGIAWTQLGTTQTAAGITTVYSGTSPIEIGSRVLGTVEPSRGKFFRAQVYDGIGGTLAFDANFETGITTNLPTTFTESSLNAATVTVNYSGTGYRSAGVIASTYVFPGATNTFKLSAYSLLDFGASDDFTVVGILRYWNTQSAARPIVSKVIANSAPYNGWGLRFSSNSFTPHLMLETVTAGGPVVTAGAISTVTGVINRTTQTDQVYTNATAGTALSISAVGASTSFYTMRVGTHFDGGQHTDMEFISAAIFRRALSAGEVATLNSYFQGRVA